ncbi:hypothetical protein [Thiopseudomonas denitrificans]|uniref:Uncharacterized protein n=1 Tax=Thiopseudomonas denitrificans TaxID=1501432 RepID=A0A4R6TUX7_9GAMM|nr:hypothetical protein [Thiopseudomonas denitrificans]TDQ37568.1 hypothetical protein DFQ45_10773 [Thiopseudomonas denitrificans]
MDIKKLTRLVEICEATTDPVIQLITLKRMCRLYCEHLDGIAAERRTLSRKAARLRRFEPFTRLAADTLEQQARDHKAEQLAVTRTNLASIGGFLMLYGNTTGEAISFNRLCDILNISQPQRAEARREGATTLTDLVFIHRFEDSAAGYMFRACMYAAAEIIRTAPAGTLPDPFAPGEVFGPKLPPKLTVVRSEAAGQVRATIH